MTAENNTSYLAHVRQLPDGRWIEHFLEEHLLAVAVLAAEFASVFNSQDWARLSGLWHDLGKFREKFQQYIKSVSGYDAEAISKAPGRVDHSTAGAIHAIEKLGMPGRIIAYLIAGHHAGLPDWNGEAASLFQRLENGKAQGYLTEARLAEPDAVLLDQPPLLHSHLRMARSRSGSGCCFPAWWMLTFWIRKPLWMSAGKICAWAIRR